MKIITYLGFTLLSIIIQFSVMDFIKVKPKIDNKTFDLNTTSSKKKFNDILKDMTQKPHALYYRTNINKIVDGNTSSTRHNYAALPEFIEETSTAMSSTMLDLFYDDNVTVSDDSFTTVTEPLLTSTDYDNATDISFIDKKNKSSVHPKTLPKRPVDQECNCNLRFEICDINCCCDNDCSDIQIKMFDCTDGTLHKKRSDDYCYLPFSFSNYLVGSSMDSLFCVVKTNLPDKRQINHFKHDASIISKSFKWHNSKKARIVQDFKKKVYEYGDSIWLLRNGSVYYVDSPLQMMNTYCSDRKPMKFLKEENIKCNVKITDLEIFNILNIFNDSSVISVTEKHLNTSTLNCSTLHCTNWTAVVCDDRVPCVSYDKQKHEPFCSENTCTHLALRVDYIFYYYDSRIINATIKLYTQNVSLNVPFMTQEINIKFFIANKSIDQFIEFSGNPGYILGLPVLVSYTESNHTDYFFNNTSTAKKYLPYPENRNGICLFNNTNNFVQFGYNKRLKCRYYHEGVTLFRNATNYCQSIQNNISYIGLNQRIMVSPLGNPSDLSDEHWIRLKIYDFDRLLYGNLNAQKTKLYCHNIITRIALIFTHADVSEAVTNKNKILSAKIEVTMQNISWSVDDLSTVVTFDIIFIDETKPTVYEYAGGPQLNIHLPKDFFFPFPSNECSVCKYSMCTTLFICFVVILCK